MKKERTLSSIEVRTLMMDTLAYEGDDIDSEGKNTWCQALKISGKENYLQINDL